MPYNNLGGLYIYKAEMHSHILILHTALMSLIK